MSIDLSAFEQVIEHFQLGQIYDLRPILLPTLNPAVLMNGHFLIELSIDDKFENPVYAMQLLADLTVPVSRVRHVDNTRSHFPFSVLVIEQANGAKLLSIWPGLPPREQQQCAFKAGVYLAQCHQQRFSQFGALSDIQKGKACVRWIEWLDAKAQWFLMLIEQAHLLSPLLITQARHKSSRFMESAQTIKHGVLCHGSFDFNAILTRRGQVLQMIGFDRALSADPAWDFRNYRTISHATPGGLAPFCDGYQSINTFDEHFFERAEFYSLVGEMETLCLSKHLNDTSGLKESMSRFKGMLDSH